jgi:hypothetical protein
MGVLTDFENQISYTGKLIIRELLIWETLYILALTKMGR